jgi:hypothetical protein
LAVVRGVGGGNELLRVPSKKVSVLLTIARRWRKWAESQLTGENDDFLRQELEEDYERMLLPHLRQITKDDNEYFYWGSKVQDNITILTLEIEKAKLERAIREAELCKTTFAKRARNGLARMTRWLGEFASSSK